MRSTRLDLLEEIKGMPVVDTHEHLESEEMRLERPVDLFNTFLIHYASCDLVSAGMPLKDMDFLKGGDGDLDKKWRIFAPYWDKAKNTVYCQALVRAVQELYDAADLTEETYREIDQRMKAANQKGLYHHILKERCGIEISLLDGDPHCDPAFFKPVARFDQYIALRSKDTIRGAEERFNQSIHSLADWTAFLKGQVQAVKDHFGIAAIKSGLAYNRILAYERTEPAAAERIFTRILSTRDFVDWYSYKPLGAEAKALEDYLMHVLVQTAAELDLPMQIHTGLQEGNGNYIAHSNPVHLNNLFLEYPRTRFDVFHAGYPYGGELIALAKNFANVYVDLCWTHLISREYAVQFIEEFLETVPANKLFGFGGDYCFAEGVYGHLEIARENIAAALAAKVEKGYLSPGDARRIARWMLYDNPKTFFNL